MIDDNEKPLDIGLRFEVIYSAQDLIQVRVIAWNGRFGGTVDLYLGIGGLEEIATKLSGFPVSVSDVRDIQLGAFGSKSAGGIHMRLYCVDAAGHALVESRIESGDLSGEPIESVSLSIRIEAAAVDSFVADLSRLGRERTGKARLNGRGV